MHDRDISATHTVQERKPRALAFSKWGMLLLVSMIEANVWGPDVKTCGQREKGFASSWQYVFSL
jgi:hypothetical protein